MKIVMLLHVPHLICHMSITLVRLSKNCPHSRHFGQNGPVKLKRLIFSKIIETLLGTLAWLPVNVNI